MFTHYAIIYGLALHLDAAKCPIYPMEFYGIETIIRVIQSSPINGVDNIYMYRSTTKDTGARTVCIIRLLIIYKHIYVYIRSFINENHKMRVWKIEQAHLIGEGVLQLMSCASLCVEK